jgi:seryl-tRNA synthetase
MLDIKRIRKEPEKTEALLRRRGDISLRELLEKDNAWREIVTEAEQLKATQNRDSKQIPVLKKQGKDIGALTAEMKALSEKIGLLDAQSSEIEAEINEMLLNIPNLPNENIAVGESDADNVEVRKVGTPPVFGFESKAHWDIGTDLGILDFERAAKVAGARFSMFIGEGAKLERAIISFMLDLHTLEHDYTEVLPPFMVNRTSMRGTGQLPKFEEDAFNLRNNDYFMIPTAEVPVTNIFRDEILNIDDLPCRFTAYTPCFRAEAGSAGRDTRGLIRNHQFDKVELVKFTHPDRSYEEHEKAHARRGGSTEKTRPALPRHGIVHGRSRFFRCKDVRS